MMDLFEAAVATRGTAYGANVPFCSVSTDSRGIGAGELFVALAGDRFDGHDFLGAARDRGAVAAMVDAARVAALAPLGLPLLAVEDSRRGLGRLAAHWRRQFDLPLIAVTGSNGKTTVKEMIASILRAQAVLDDYDPDLAVLATRGNLNNDIGLPLTLLGLHAVHRAGVVEIGMNHPGEIAYLAAIAAPTVCLVNNAQRAHIEGLGSVDAVAREKGTIISAAGEEAIAVINMDDPSASAWRDAAGRRRVVGFGIDAAADVRGIAVPAGFETQLSLVLGGQRIDLRVHLPGTHNARNATAAAAATFAAGIGIAAIQAGLAAFRGVAGRLQRHAGRGGATVIDDSYNANPDSVRAGLEVLAAIPGRRILVFGDMGEIGADVLRWHAEVGAYARSAGIDGLFALGEASAEAVRAFGDGARCFTQADELVAALLPHLDDDVTVLVKGSRFMKMERIVAALRADCVGGEGH